MMTATSRTQQDNYVRTVQACRDFQPEFRADPCDMSNLRHLAEPLKKAVGLLEAVSFKEVTESVCRGRTTDARG